MDLNNWFHCACCNVLSSSLCLWFHTDTELDIAIGFPNQTKKALLVQIYQSVPYVPGQIGNNVVDDCRRERKDLVGEEIPALIQ